MSADINLESSHSRKMGTFHIDSHEGNLMKTLYRLQQCGELCDVSIIAKGGCISAHMSVLAAASSHYFTNLSKMLKVSLPAKSYCLDSSDIDVHVLKEVIHFIYTGDICLNDSSVNSLQAAFDNLGLKEAALVCQKHLSGEAKLGEHSTWLPELDGKHSDETGVLSVNQPPLLPSIAHSGCVEDSSRKNPSEEKVEESAPLEQERDQPSTHGQDCDATQVSARVEEMNSVSNEMKSNACEDWVLDDETTLNTNAPDEKGVSNICDNSSVSGETQDMHMSQLGLSITSDCQHVPSISGQGFVDAGVQTDDISWQVDVPTPLAHTGTHKNRRKAGRPRKVMVPPSAEAQPVATTGTSTTSTGRRRGRPRKNPIEPAIKLELQESADLETNAKLSGNMESTLTNVGLEIVQSNADLTSVESSGISEKQGMTLRKRVRSERSMSIPNSENEDPVEEEDREEMDIVAGISDEDGEIGGNPDEMDVDDVDQDWRNKSNTLNKVDTVARTRRGRKRGPKAKVQYKGNKRKYFYTGLDCTKCGRSFATTEQKRQHKKQCKEKGFHKNCHQCGFFCEDREEMMAHRNTHNKEKKRQNWKKYSEVLKTKHMCPICGKGFTLEWVKFSHMYCKHNIPLEENGKYPVIYCDFPDCQYRSLQQYLIDYHKRNRHGGSKDFMCELCGSSFAHKFYLNTHIKNKHSSSEGFYPCEICGKQVTSLNSLKIHKKLMHSSDIWLQCDKCDFTTKYRDTFENHQFKVHGEPLPIRRSHYKCVHCPYTSLHKNAFNSHMRRHRGEKPFKCPDCAKTFSSKSECTNHRKWHDKANRVHCPYDGCKFSSVIRQTVEFHVRVVHTHKHEKPWICHICDYRTNVKGNLKLHLRKVHKLIVPGRQSLVIREVSQGQTAETESQSIPDNSPPTQVPRASPTVSTEPNPRFRSVGPTEGMRKAGVQYTLADVSFPSSNDEGETVKPPKKNPMLPVSQGANVPEFHESVTGIMEADANHLKRACEVSSHTDGHSIAGSQFQPEPTLHVQSPCPHANPENPVSQPVSLVYRPAPHMAPMHSTPPPAASPIASPGPHHTHMGAINTHPAHLHPAINSPPPTHQPHPIPTPPPVSHHGNPTHMSEVPGLTLPPGHPTNTGQMNMQPNQNNQGTHPYNMTDMLMMHNYMYMGNME